MNTSLSTTIQKDGLTIHALNLKVNNKSSFLSRIIGFIKFVLWATYKTLFLKPDIIIATSTPLTIAVPALIKKMFHNTPYIFECRDIWPDVPISMGIIRNSILIKISFLLEQIAYRYAEHIVTLSTDMKINILRKNIPDEKVSVIPNIANIKRFQHPQFATKRVTEILKIAGDRKVLVYTGTIGKVNNLSYMVELAYKTREITNKICFVVVGDGNDLDIVLKNAIAKKVLNKCFYICKPISKAELPALLKNITATCSWVGDNKALWANSANKFFDALAAGKPIIINHGGWQSDIILNNSLGLTLSPSLREEDVNDFISFMTDENQINKYGYNALKVAKKFYNMEHLAGKYIKILNDLYNKKET